MDLATLLGRSSAPMLLLRSGGKGKGKISLELLAKRGLASLDWTQHQGSYAQTQLRSQAPFLALVLAFAAPGTDPSATAAAESVIYNQTFPALTTLSTRLKWLQLLVVLSGQAVGILRPPQIGKGS